MNTMGVFVPTTLMMCFQEMLPLRKGRIANDQFTVDVLLMG